MTREEAIDRLTYIMSDLNEFCNESKHMSDDDKKEMESLEMAIKALKQEPCEDVMAIHTQGLDEGIRCAMCTNSMKSNRGCDGGCVVNEGMYKEVMNTIKKHIVPPVTPTRKHGEWEREEFDLGADLPIRVGYKCSECGNYSDSKFNFCPDCGADMRGSEE